jgi:hypothetical protein
MHEDLPLYHYRVSWAIHRYGLAVKNGVISVTAVDADAAAAAARALVWGRNFPMVDISRIHIREAQRLGMAA